MTEFIGKKIDELKDCIYEALDFNNCVREKLSNEEEYEIVNKVIKYFDIKQALKEAEREGIRKAYLAVIDNANNNLYGKSNKIVSTLEFINIKLKELEQEN
jgi:hypothetical protein